MPKRSTRIGGDIHGFYFSGDCGGCNIFTFTPLVWASGGDILAEDGKKATLDTPQMRGAIELYRGSMVKKGYVPRGRQDRHRRQFLRRLRHRQDRHLADRRLRHRQPRNTQLSQRRVRRHLPARQGRRQGPPSPAATISSSPEGAKKIAAVKEFLDFVYSLEGQTILAKYGSLPTRGDIAEEALKALDQRYQVARRGHGQRPHALFARLQRSDQRANGPWKQMMNEVFFGDDVDGSLSPMRRRRCSRSSTTPASRNVGRRLPATAA